MLFKNYKKIYNLASVRYQEKPGPWHFENASVSHDVG